MNSTANELRNNSSLYEKLLNLPLIQFAISPGVHEVMWRDDISGGYLDVAYGALKYGSLHSHPCRPPSAPWSVHTGSLLFPQHRDLGDHC